MLSFAYLCGLAFVAIIFITSGVGHVIRFSSFRSLLHTHDVMPQTLVTLAALVVTIFELGSGGIAVLRLIGNRHDFVDVVLFTVTASAGLAFVLYLSLLLQRPAGRVSCGCSPLPSPLTPVSLIPAVLLIVISLAALVAAIIGQAHPLSATDSLSSLGAWLPILWGLTLASIAILLPASVPDPNLELQRWIR